MKSAYMDELKGLLKDIDALRATMEPWYALRLEDEHVVHMDGPSKGLKTQDHMDVTNPISNGI